MKMHEFVSRKVCIALLALAAPTMVASESLAEIMTVSVLKDAMIFGHSDGTDTNNASGMGPALFTGADSGLDRKRSLIQFDFSLIPDGAIITDVSMTLHLGQVAGSGGSGTGTSTYSPRVISIYSMLQDWGEGASGSPTSSGIGGTGHGYSRVNGDCTWDYAIYNSNSSAAVKWGEPGSPVKGGYFSSISSCDQSFVGPYSSSGYPAYTFSSGGMAADVQAWVDGTMDDYGWMLMAPALEESTQSFLGFWSSEGADAYLAQFGGESLAPTLTITYSIPEPASLSIILLSAPALLRRRARA